MLDEPQAEQTRAHYLQNAVVSARWSRGLYHRSSCKEDCRMSNYPSPDVEQSLVKRCLAGDQIAWYDVFHACHPRVIRTLRVRRHLSEDVAEELAQHMWHSLVKRHLRPLGRYDFKRAKLATYLGKLALEEARLAQRRRKPAPKVHSLA